MTRCDRFEAEALLRLEQGLPLDEHFSTCPDCREARAAYDRLREEIAAAGAGDEPSPEWQARVWQTIEQRRESGRRRWAAWLLMPAAAAAVATLLIVNLPGRPQPPSLSLEVVAGETVHRGTDAKPGDRLVLRADTGGATHAELRVYRNDVDLLLSCSGEAPCTLEDGELQATFELATLGSYQALLLFSEKPLPRGGAGLDRDAGAALAGGAEMVLGPKVVVR
jgi:hypothetical protein